MRRLARLQLRAGARPPPPRTAIAQHVQMDRCPSLAQGELTSDIWTNRHTRSREPIEIGYPGGAGSVTDDQLPTTVRARGRWLRPGLPARTASSRESPTASQATACALARRPDP